MEELLLLINYVLFARKKFNQFFKIYMKTFLSGEKVEGEMVPYAEGSSVKGSSQQMNLWPLGLGRGAVISRRIPLTTGGLVNDTTPDLLHGCNVLVFMFFPLFEFLLSLSFSLLFVFYLFRDLPP